MWIIVSGKAAGSCRNEYRKEEKSRVSYIVHMPSFSRCSSIADQGGWAWAWSTPMGVGLKRRPHPHRSLEPADHLGIIRRKRSRIPDQLGLRPVFTLPITTTASGRYRCSKVRFLVLTATRGTHLDRCPLPAQDKMRNRWAAPHELGRGHPPTPPPRPWATPLG